MSPLYHACENAIFEALVLFPEYLPEGIEQVDVCTVGGELLASGQCGAFVYLYGRGLALRVRERAEYLRDEQWLATMKDAIVHGYSLYDSQGSVGGITCTMSQA